MGKPKGLLPIAGMTWLEYQLKQFRHVGGSRAVVVLGFQSAKYLKELPWLESCSPSWSDLDGLKVTCVTNSQSQYGPFSTLQCGIVKLICDFKERQYRQYRQPRGVFVLPIDVPVANGLVWETLAENLRPGTLACIPVQGAKGGHPVLLSEDFLGKLRSIPVDSPTARLDHQIRALDQSQVVRVPVNDSTVLLNLNHLEQWATYLDSRDHHSQ